MYAVLDGNKEDMVVSSAPFQYANTLQFMHLINMEGLINDYLFLGFEGGFELRNPRHIEKSVMIAKHPKLQNIRNVEFIETEKSYRGGSTWYMAILCAHFDPKTECEKYTFHQYKFESKKDRDGLSE